MTRTKKIIISILLAGLFAATGHVYYLTTLSAEETYPKDTFLETEKNKVALIIVAHDDDAISAAGTISMLCAKGWTVKEICFFRGWENKDSIRKLSLKKAGAIQGLNEIVPIELKFRNDTITNKEPWNPLPYEEFSVVFKVDSMEQCISRFIQKNNPSVIFTLDEVIGGYGHPEHVLVSRLVLSYCDKNKSKDDFGISRIYQPVFPPTLAESILGTHKTYVRAKKVYNCTGMPLPDTEINISAYGRQKKEAMKSYSTEQHSLNLIWPYYSYYPSSIYFKIFDREFFRVINVEK